MKNLESVVLSDERHFKFISGLWTGDKGPLAQAAVLRSTNFRGDGFFDYSDIAELQVRTDQLSTRKLERGDIVIERSGGGPKQPVGRVAVFDPPDNRTYATSNFTTALRVVDRSAFEPHFVNFFLHSLYLAGDTESLQRATTGIRNLDWAEYQAFAVPRLPLDEQRLIAKLLLRVYRGSVVNTQQLEILADLKRAAMRVLFTKGLRGEAQKDTEIGPLPESWEPTSCEAIFKLTSGKTRPGDVTAEPSAERPYPVLGGNGVMGFSALWNVELPEILVIGRVGEYCGAVHRVFGRVWITDNALYAKEWLLPEANLHFVGKFLEHYDLNRFKRMAGQPLVTQGMINEHSIPLPRPDEQREIVVILDAIDRKIDLHERKRTVLDELFRALLHKLMTGEIRVADLDLSALQAGEPEGAAA